MPNALHFGASASAIAPTPKMPTVLLCRSCAGKRRHSRASWRADGARQIAGQRQHRAERRFRHRRAVNAVDIGDDDVLAQRRLVDEVVDAGAERLNPFQPWRLLQHIVGQHRREGEERVGVRDMRPDLGVMIDQVDREFGKARPQPVAILIADVLGVKPSRMSRLVMRRQGTGAASAGAVTGGPPYISWRKRVRRQWCRACLATSR